MTLVNIDLRNQGYETGPDDRVIFYSLLVREGEFGTISTAPVEVELTDGKASVDLAPGPVGVQIIAGQVADTRVKIGEVPPSGPTTLNAVMMVTPAYTPALQQAMIAAIQQSYTNAMESLGDAPEQIKNDMQNLAASAIASINEKFGEIESTIAQGFSDAEVSIDQRIDAAEASINQSFTDVLGQITTSYEQAYAQVEGISQQAQSAITTVEAVKDTIVGTAQAAAEHAAETRGIRQQLEEAYALSEAGQSLPPRLTESAMKAAFAPGGGQQVLPLTDTSIRPVSESASPLGVIDGVLYGYSLINGTNWLRSSPDGGLTWDNVTPMPVSSRPRSLIKAGDEVLMGIGMFLFRSTGWGTQNLSWGTPRITGTHASSVFLDWGVSVVGNTVFAAEYGLRGVSGRAWISHDLGVTFTQVFDVQDWYTGEAATTAHLHAAVLDPYHNGPHPRIWMANGDVGARGVFISDDLGVTWEKTSINEQPTALHPAPEGVYVGTDDPDIVGVRLIDRGTMQIRQVWLSPEALGTSQVAHGSIEDPETGIIYIYFRSSLPGTRGMIVGVLDGRAWPVWWDPEIQTGYTDHYGPLHMCGVTQGRKIAVSLERPDGGEDVLLATASKVGARDWVSNPDSGNVLGAKASHLGGVASGFRATSTGESAIAVGHTSESTAFHSTALGPWASATAAETVALGPYAKTSGQFAVAVGKAQATQSHAISIGGYANAGSIAAIAIGRDALAVAGVNDFPIAIGDRAKAQGALSVALGVIAKATAGETTAVGIESHASAGQATALGRKAKASGASSVTVGDSTEASGLGGIAVGMLATSAGESSVSIGRLATSSGFHSVAVGPAAKSTNEAVALGPRSDAGGQFAIAVGRAIATHTYAISIGGYATAGSIAAIAIGRDAVATSNGFPVAIGDRAKVTGSLSVALGVAAQVPSTLGTAVGAETRAEADYATAIGAQARSTHQGAVAIGYGTQSTGTYQVALGTRGLTMKNVAEGSVAPSDGALIYASGGNIRVRSGGAISGTQTITLSQGAAISDPTPEDLTTSITGILSYLRANGFIAT